MFSIYILKSITTGRHYIGYTSDLKLRLEQHNDGINISTKNRGPWEIIYSECGFATREAALRREREIKRMKGGRQFQQLIKENLAPKT